MKDKAMDFGAAKPMTGALLRRQMVWMGFTFFMLVPGLAALFLLSRGIDVFRFLAVPPLLAGLFTLLVGVRPDVVAKFPSYLRPDKQNIPAPSRVVVALGLSYLVMSAGMWFRTSALTSIAMAIPVCISWAAHRRGRHHYEP